MIFIYDLKQHSYIKQILIDGFVKSPVMGEQPPLVLRGLKWDEVYYNV